MNRRWYLIFAIGLSALVSVSAAAGAGGALDSSFDGDGRVVTDVAGSYEAAHAVAIHTTARSWRPGRLAREPRGTSR